MFIQIFQRLFCKHEFKVFYNIYGDEIIYRNYNRSVWRCEKCGKEQCREYLVDGAPARPDIEQMIKECRQIRG